MEYRPFEDNGIKQIRKIQSNILKMSYEGLQKKMDLDVFSEALSYINDELALPIEPRTLEIILSSDGYAYASLIDFGMDDTETRSAISNAIANHFMHRPWPMYLEKGFPGVDEFENRLLIEIEKSK